MCRDRNILSGIVFEPGIISRISTGNSSDQFGIHRTWFLVFILNMADSGQDSIDAGSDPSSSTDHDTQCQGGHTPVYTREEFQSTKYRMNSENRGLAIIFNNKTFDEKTTRTGTDNDAAKMHQRFFELGFRVKMHTNKKASQMKSIIQQEAAADFTSCDCFACVILSYGEEGLVYGTDKPVQIENFVDPFKRNKSLAGKPKLFFIQACNKEEPQDVMDANFVMGDSGEEEFIPVTYRIPVEADIFIAYSVVPGYFSWQGNVNKGSWFIEALSDVLKRFGTSLDLMTMMIRVNKLVAHNFELHKSTEFFARNKQIACITSMLTKEVRFPFLTKEVRDVPVM
ncbi:caspase-7-like [Haliotis asinina]|uniref:caspase-7-like n=1 Tax=Haliotis asinina TaxID=109174 RepID=UPI0035320636